MIKTSLTVEETEEIVEKIANWSKKYDLPAATTFLFEVNRPIAPITAHILIGFGGILNTVMPLDMRDLGLFLLEDANTLKLEERIKELTAKND
ncbi:hypothetical protein J6X96_06155 [bacterium]|nr:hypothetical protein [bacterium]